MSESRIDLADIVQWLRSTESVLSGGATMAGVKERSERLGVNGLFDFEVVRIADGHQLFFRHEQIDRIDDPSLNAALAAFVAALAG